MSRFRQSSGTRPRSSKALAQPPFNRRKRSARPPSTTEQSVLFGFGRLMIESTPTPLKTRISSRSTHLEAGLGSSYETSPKDSPRAIDDSGVLGKRGVGAHRVETSFRYRNPRLCVSRPIGHRSVPLPKKEGAPEPLHGSQRPIAKAIGRPDIRVSTRTSAEEPKVSEACPHIGEVRVRVVNAIRARKNFAYCRSRLTTSNVLNPPFSDGGSRHSKGCRGSSVSFSISPSALELATMETSRETTSNLQPRRQSHWIASNARKAMDRRKATGTAASCSFHEGTEKPYLASENGRRT
jgi:hypothetical protein